ncbi:MAG: class I SAM-dependent methyltransferase [Chloroflexi bacterium]|nr:class I SAM-dependent methyltransferase [Chloroflexota bacterium]
MNNLPLDGRQFDANYYATGCGAAYGYTPHWIAQFESVASYIHQHIAPASLLDAGCAFGLLVDQMRARGVEAWGVDISEYAISQVRAEIRAYCRQGSVAQPFGRRYDLITCIEVLEHMPPQEAEAAVTNFCAHTDDVLFSSSPLDYTEATHINVHPLDYWARLFAAHGFLRDIDFDASFLTPWAVRFRRSAAPAIEIVQSYERRQWRLLDENTQLRAELQRIRTSAQDAAALRSERDQLATLVRGYENGRFIQLMRKLKKR